MPLKDRTGTSRSTFGPLLIIDQQGLAVRGQQGLATRGLLYSLGLMKVVYQQWATTTTQAAAEAAAFPWLAPVLVCRAALSGSVVCITDVGSVRY